jgi:hypothetical protein
MIIIWRDLEGCLTATGGGDSVIVLMVLVIVRSKSVETFSPNGKEPAPITSEALVAQYLHDS